MGITGLKIERAYAAIHGVAARLEWPQYAHLRIQHHGVRTIRISPPLVRRVYCHFPGIGGLWPQPIVCRADLAWVLLFIGKRRSPGQNSLALRVADFNRTIGGKCGGLCFAVCI